MGHRGEHRNLTAVLPLKCGGEKLAKNHVLSSKVVTLAEADEAFLSAFFDIRVGLFHIAKSAMDAYDNDRLLGDGGGLGVGAAPNTSYPYSANISGWNMWNPIPFPFAEKNHTRLGSVLQDFISGVGWKPRWVTEYGTEPAPKPFVFGPIKFSFRELFLEELRGRALGQDKSRRWGTWRTPDGKIKDRRRIRIPFD